MTTLDLRSVVLITSIMLAIMGIVMFSTYRDLPANIRGMGHWALGSLFLSATGALVVLRDVLPEWWSVMVADTALLCGFALWLLGTQLFYERKPWYTAIASCVAIGFVCVTWGVLVAHSYTFRLSVMLVLMLGMSGAQFGLIVRYGMRHVSTYFLALVLLFQILVFLIRGLTIFLAGHEPKNVFASTPPQVLFVGTLDCSILLLAVGFVMLATHRMIRELAWYANRDPLTGVLNRRAFATAYDQARQDAWAEGHGLTLLIADLDHFKSINDQHGHHVGDQVLVDFCERATRVLGEQALFARIGGEEFAAILHAEHHHDAFSRAEHLRQVVSQTAVALLPSYTCSIGVAMASGELDETLEQLMRAADSALYRAKCAGRNRVETAFADTGRMVEASQA